MPTSVLRTSVALVLAGIVGGAVHAAPRTFVASTGNDVNACSLTAPCRTFTGALSKTDPGGEIVALDSGDFSPVTIGKAVSIIGPASLDARIKTNIEAAAIIVQAGASDVVSLRGISLTSGTSPSTAYGIWFKSGMALHIDGVAINDFNSGVFQSASGFMAIRDSRIHNTLFDAITVSVLSGGTGAFAIDRVNIEGAGYKGLRLGGIANGYIRDSHISFVRDAANTQGSGIDATANSPGQRIDVAVDRCEIVSSYYGLLAVVSNGATAANIRLSNSTVLDNTVRYSITGGASLISLQNNNLGAADDGSTAGSITASGKF